MGVVGPLLDPVGVFMLLLGKGDGVPEFASGVMISYGLFVPVGVV